MKIALIGAGQQGTSQGLAFAELDAVEKVVFCDTNLERWEQILEKAKEHGIDVSKLSFVESLQEAVADADVIGLNTPGDVFGDLAAQISEHAKEGATLYDNGSGKVRVIADIEKGLGDNLKQLHYFPSHFFVGRSGTGPEFADPKMYDGQTVAIMGTDNLARMRFIDLIKGTGVKTIRTDLSPAKHDEGLGLYSHHNTFAVTALMLAFPRVNIGGKPVQIGRFLSSTRVAAHGVDGTTFWGPIANDNADAIVAAANIFSKKLQDIHDALKESDPSRLTDILKQAASYVDEIEPDRSFEGLEGDQHDLKQLVGDNKHFTPIFDPSHVAMPIIFAAASALTAQDYEANGGQPFSSIGNSSFHDSIRPMRDNFQKSADYIWELKKSVVTCVSILRKQYAGVVDAIEDHDADKVETMIQESHRIRSQLPQATTEARNEFVID